MTVPPHVTSIFSPDAPKLPIAVVASDFVLTGGMDVANYGLADYLARRGHRVDLVSHRVAPELAGVRGVAVHPVARPFNSNLLAVPLLDRAGRQIAEATRAVGGKVVVNGGNCRWPAINWVHYVHAAYQSRSATGIARRIKSSVGHALFLRTERQSLKIATLVIANSDRTRKDLIEHLAVDPALIRTVYYGCDPKFQPATAERRAAAKAAFGWNAEHPVVVFIGALGDRRKGFDTVFAAWETLCRKPAWDGDLAIVGTGAEMPVWKQRAAAAGLSSRFHFLGFRRDVPEILKAADALVAPTRYEAYGLGVQEALCCDLPAFVSRDAGVAERYPRSLSSLLLENCNDAEELAGRLERWRNDRESLANSVAEFGAILRRRTWDDMAAEIEQLITES